MQTSAPATLTPTKLAEAVGISVPYASQIMKGRRIPLTPMAVRIYRATGHKFGPIAKASEDEIAVLERFQGAA
jgi:transcriptional regulator with XRE-family HTH domain